MLKAQMYETQYKNYNADLVMYESLLDKNFPVVEFGSGTGRITLYLLKKGFTVYGIEKDEEYKNYFLEKLKSEKIFDKFSFINDTSEIDFYCNIIFPFNVLFYLNEDELENEFRKICKVPFKKIIFETDNIIELRRDNFLTKHHQFNDKNFNEVVEFFDNVVLIKNEVKQGKRVILKFNYELFLHHASTLLKLYKTYFGQYVFYGDFLLSKYMTSSTKLIAVINRTN